MYRKLVPASKSDTRVLMTPRIRVRLVYVRKWVETHNQTMIAISEGPFDTFNDDYRKYEKNFKIPRPPLVMILIQRMKKKRSRKAQLAALEQVRQENERLRKTAKLPEELNRRGMSPTCCTSIMRRKRRRTRHVK